MFWGKQILIGPSVKSQINVSSTGIEFSGSSEFSSFDSPPSEVPESSLGSDVIGVPLYLMIPLARLLASSRESIQLNVRLAMTKSLPSLSNVRSM